MSIATNHLSKKSNIPFSKSYNFPLSGIIISIILGFVVLTLAQINFNYYKKKYFNKKFTWKAIIGFVSTTLGYISILYVPCYFFLIWAGNKPLDYYNLIVGLCLTLLMCTVVIIAVFATEIYSLHKLETLQGKLKVKKSGSHTFVSYNEIAYIFSENKVVYLVKFSGQIIITDFTLNEIEEIINNRIFFRANRQVVINFRAVEKIEPIENGKLAVTLKPIVSGRNQRIIISRYKKKSFQDWLDKK